MSPGATQFTRIPYLATSTPSERVNISSPALPAEYGSSRRWTQVTAAWTEDTLTMRPSVFFSTMSATA